jgi:predicted transcriptional regulator of viral defense system
MKQSLALEQLSNLDKQGIYVFTLNDLGKLFYNESEKTLLKSVTRLVQSKILEKATKGIYVFAYSKHKNRFLIEAIASVLRRGHLTYISLESALSEYGTISQIPMGVTTFMTTGAAGKFKTSYGPIIEFTKTKRDELTLLRETAPYKDAPMRIATLQRALGDLKRVGRNVAMVNINASAFD